MNIIRHLSIFLLSTFALAASAADAPTLEAQTAILEAQFFLVYPDLTGHRDTVNNGCLALMAEGYNARTQTELFTMMAARARAILQASPLAAPTLDATEFAAQEQASREEAQRNFPQVAVPASPLYRRVSQDRAKLTSTYPKYFKNPQWPMLLAQGAAAAIAFEADQQIAARLQNSPQQQQMTPEQMLSAIELIKSLKGMTHTSQIQQRRLDREREWNDPLNKLRREVEALKQQQNSQNK